jgi:signal transduction histidine kinase
MNSVLASHSQNKTIDSLEKVLQSQREDTNKALTLNRLTENLLDEGQWKKGLEYANMSIELSGKLNFKRIEASAYENRGICYGEKGDYSQTEKDLLTALQIRTEIGDKRGIAQNYLSLANLYSRQSNDPKALEYGYKANQAALELKDKIGIPFTYDFLSSVYLDQGNDSDAEKNMKLAIEAYQQNDYNLQTGRSYSGIADIQFSRKNYEEALANYFKALAISEKYGRFKSVNMNIYLSIGNVYQEQGALASSLGNNALALKKYRDALNQYDSAINIANQINTNDNDDNITEINSRKAKIYIQLKRFAEARIFLQKYLLVSEKLNNKVKLENCYSSLAALDSAEGHYKQAYENYKKYILYKDSISASNNAKKFLQVKMQYEYDRKDAVAREGQAKKDLEAQRIRSRQILAIILLVALSLGILIIALIQWRNNRQKAKSNLLLATQKQKVENTLAELKSTQAQLIQSEKMASLGELTAGIAHEIQNPLNFVNNFSEVNAELIEEMQNEIKAGNKVESDAIAGAIKENNLKISHHGKRADSIVKGMLMHSRNSSGQKELTDINSLVEEYLNLAYHGLRAKDKTFNATINIDLDKNLQKINIIPQEMGRVLLNLVNNAFYAVAEKNKNPHPPEVGVNFQPQVTVSTKLIVAPSGGRAVQIRISDNGNGISQKNIDKIFQPFFTTKPTGQGTGLGLSLSYDIIKSMGGEIKVETKEGEYARFVLFVPYTTDS